MAHVSITWIAVAACYRLERTLLGCADLPVMGGRSTTIKSPLEFMKNEVEWEWGGSPSYPPFLALSMNG